MNNSDQTWTIVSAMFGMLVLHGGLILILVNVKVNGLRAEMAAKIETINEKISGLRREVLALMGHPEPEPDSEKPASV